MIKILLLSLCQVCLTHTTTVDSPLRTLFEVWMKCIYYQPCMYVQRTDRDLFESGTSIKFSWWKWRLRWDLYYTLSGLGYAFPYTYILFSNLCFHFFWRSRYPFNTRFSFENSSLRDHWHKITYSTKIIEYIL